MKRRLAQLVLWLLVLTLTTGAWAQGSKKQDPARDPARNPGEYYKTLRRLKQLETIDKRSRKKEWDAMAMDVDWECAVTFAAIDHANPKAR